MDSIRASEAPDTGSIPVEATTFISNHQPVCNSEKTSIVDSISASETLDTGSLPDCDLQAGIPVEATTIYI
jgi:hypothetical protein